MTWTKLDIANLQILKFQLPVSDLLYCFLSQQNWYALNIPKKVWIIVWWYLLMFYYYEVRIKLSIPQHASVAKFNDLQGGLILGKKLFRIRFLSLTCQFQCTKIVICRNQAWKWVTLNSNFMLLSGNQKGSKFKTYPSFT